MPQNCLWLLGGSFPKDVVLCSHLSRKDGKKDQDSRAAPEPKKPEENPASVSVKGLFSTSLSLLLLLNSLLFKAATEWLEIRHCCLFEIVKVV